MGLRVMGFCIFALALLGLAGCGGDPSDGSGPTPATVTVTAKPTEQAVDRDDRDLVYPTATSLLTAAGDAGFDCPKPRTVIADTRSVDDLMCGPQYTNKAAYFRIFETEDDLEKDATLFGRVARNDLRDGREPMALLGGSNGREGATWLISANLKTVRQLRDGLGGTVIDFSKELNVAPKPEPNPKPEPEPPAVSTSFGDGTYLVGEDVQAGTYRNDGDTYGGQAPCVAYTSARPNDLAGSYISGSTTSGPGILQVNPGEYVSVQGCKTWRKAS